LQTAQVTARQIASAQQKRQPRWLPF